MDALKFPQLLSAWQVFLPNAELDASQAKARQYSFYTFSLLVGLLCCVFLVHSALVGQWLTLPDDTYPLFLISAVFLASPAIGVAYGWNADRVSLAAVFWMVPMQWLALWLNGDKAFFFYLTLILYIRCVLPRFMAWRVFTVSIVGNVLLAYYLSEAFNFKLVYLSLGSAISLFVIMDEILIHAKDSYVHRVSRFSRTWIAIGIVWSLVSLSLTAMEVNNGNVGIIFSNVMVLVSLWSLKKWLQPRVLLYVVLGYFGLSTVASVYFSGIEPIVLLIFILALAAFVLPLRALLIYTLFFLIGTMLVLDFTSSTANPSAIIILICALFLCSLFGFMASGFYVNDESLNALLAPLVQKDERNSRDGRSDWTNALHFLHRFNHDIGWQNFLTNVALGVLLVAGPLILWGYGGGFSAAMVSYLSGWSGYFWLLAIALGILGAAFLLTLRDADLQSISSSTEQSQQYNQAQTQLLGLIGHEFRDPLNNLLLLVDLISSITMLDTSAKNELRLMKASGEKLNRLMDDIIDVSHIEDGRIELIEQPVDLVALLQQIIYELKPLAQQVNVDLQLSLDDACPPSLLGDATRISQILSNLLTNAIKFSANGRVVLSVALNHNQLAFAVQDNGPGMDEATLVRVFQRFEQADNSLSRSHEGLGIGLSLSAELAQLMGGSIRAISQLGKGSVFTFYLPLTLTATQSVEAPPVSESNLLMQCHVLIVEDDPVTLEVLASALEASVASVGQAPSGKVALDILANRSIDIVLTDIAMPNMNGIELLHAIRQLPAAPKVVAITGNALAADIERYWAEGFDDVLTKPFELERLLRKMQRLLDPPVEHRS